MNGLQKTVQLSLLVLAVLASARFAGAQVPADSLSSIGFTHPDSTQPVRAYRLPTWHWSTWTLRANGNAVRRSSSRDDPLLDRDEDQFNLNLGLNPIYRSFWESEERRAFLRLSPSLALSRDGSTVSNGEEQERDNSIVATGIDVRGTLREYVASRTFLFAATDGVVEYSRLRTEEEMMDRTQSTFEIRTNVRLGVGVGRVRVVTPVIRALRVRERLRTVALGTSVSDDQVQAAARQLARRPGYQAVYDRPEKYFWHDFFERAGLSARSPFETFYVADVLREPVGVRREGSEFLVGPTGSYRRSLEREEEDSQLVERTFSEQGEIGGFARGRWYRNVTLNHQLGVDVEATYRHFVNRFTDHEIGLDGEGQWLWVLADRLRLDTRLFAELRYRSDPLGEESFRPSNQFILSSDLLIFVENSLSLSVGANMQYRYDENIAGGGVSRFRTGLQFQVNYVLSRALR